MSGRSVHGVRTARALASSVIVPLSMTQSENATEREPTRQDIVDDVRRRVRLPANVTPEQALSAVMCAFSQHVSGIEARHVFAHLPKAAQPILEPCMVHRGEPAQHFKRDGLVRRVADHLHVSKDEADDITSAVLEAVSARLPARVVEHVASQLPNDLRELWVSRRRAGAPALAHPALDEIAASAALPRDVTAVDALRVVMCGLTARLTRGEARALVDALPILLRALVETCVDERGERPETFHRPDLFARVERELHVDHAGPVVNLVFRVVKSYLRHDQVQRVASNLPKDLSDLWLEA